MNLKDRLPTIIIYYFCAEGARSDTRSFFSFFNSSNFIPPTASLPIRSSLSPSLLSPQPLHRNERNNSSSSGCPKIISLSVKRGVSRTSLLKIQLVREKAGFYGQVARRESIFSRHSALAMSLLIRRQAGERTLTWSKPSSSKSDAS